ncbi:hypothetical protein C2S51_029852 [Perilla frutescens var. frutescens]|nr:hypothetical protein C2S51_029852 [Perilla frutescens var. frutescens]
MHEGKLTSQEAEQRYDMMNVQQTIQIFQSGSADERSILRQSHPPHRGHHVGVGPTLPLFWLTFGEETSSSTGASTTSTVEDRARIRSSFIDCE